MDRLFILAINLRRPTCRKYRLAREPHDEPAERLTGLLVKRRYPNARKSLCNQLGASINIRGRSLLYLKKHNRNLASFRSDEDVTEEPANLKGGYKDEVSVPTMGVRLQRQKAMKQPETLASSLSPSMRHRVLQERRNPSSSIISRGSVIQSNECDYPPQPEQKEGASYQSCILCDAPLNPKSLTPRAWRFVLPFLEADASNTHSGSMLTKISNHTSAFPRIAWTPLSTLKARGLGWIICRPDTLCNGQRISTQRDGTVTIATLAKTPNHWNLTKRRNSSII